MTACVAASFVGVCISISIRNITETIIPFEVIAIALIGLILMDIIYGMIKFIPVKDERTGQTKRWAIGTLNDHQFVFAQIFPTHTCKQELGFTCPRHIDSISKRELL